MKNEASSEALLTPEIIKDKICVIRGKKVMIDRDLANLYGVPTMRLNQAVRRNLKRFPEDFMFQLTREEARNWISQNVISNSGLKKSLRKPPLAFTEQGIAMLSSVLNSDRAISVNIQIIRIFTKLREMVDSYKELREKVEELERNERNTEANFKEIFRVIRLFANVDKPSKRKMGFDTGLG